MKILKSNPDVMMPAISLCFRGRIRLPLPSEC
jgi:hypothetical protein